MMKSGSASRLKLAELSSAVGAGVIGIGIGALLGPALRAFAIPVLVAGLATHAWGMTDKHRIENADSRPAWSTALYWICWLALVALLIAIVAKAVR